MKSPRQAAARLAAMLPCALALAFAGCNGCSEPEETAPPTEIPAAAPPPSASVALEEDAGAPDAEIDAGKPKGPAGDPTGVVACCKAIRQNAASALADQKESMLRAADTCDALVRTPESRRALIAVRGMLAGAQLPSQCK
jgi:hypothetical protein